jgi:hypothetical protein
MSCSSGTASALCLRGNHTAIYLVCEKLKEATADFTKLAQQQNQKGTATSKPAAPN